jgi:hypothetical protein
MFLDLRPVAGEDIVGAAAKQQIEAHALRRGAEHVKQFSLTVAIQSIKAKQWGCGKTALSAETQHFAKSLSPLLSAIS